MRFKTAGLNALWGEVGNLSHPDCPFLDRHYSPSTRMPVCDLTPYVTDFLMADDLESLTELWHYIGHTYESLKLALMANLPGGLQLSDYANHELRASYLLTVRMANDNGAAFVGSKVVSTILSTRNVEVSGRLEDELNAFIYRELETLKKNGEPEIDTDKTLEDTWSALRQGTIGCENFSGIMKQVPPMVRISFANAIRDMQSPYRSFYNNRFHFGNGYGDRVYGCSEIIGREYAKSLGILNHPRVEETGVSAKVTKDEIIRALNGNGIRSAKSSSRRHLLDLATNVPGLLQNLQDINDPDFLVIRPDSWDEARVWADRTKRLIWLSAALISAMGEVGIAKRLIPATSKEVLHTHEHMAVAILKVNEQTEGTCFAFPAWELVEYGDQQEQNCWVSRWMAAGEAVGWLGVLRDTAKMIALKDSPIWLALGNGTGGYDDALRNPYPPFVIGSKMGWRGVDRRECIQHGLIGPTGRSGVPAKVVITG